MKEILIATKNEGKMRDFVQAFSKYGISVRSLLNLQEEIPDIEETGSTFKENAAIKAETIAEQFNLPVLADDSGLEVDALDGRPGVYSARYAGEEKNDTENLHKVLQEMSAVPLEKRTARFMCVLALAQPGEPTIFKTGSCEGIIGAKPVGENGFGYDPIFIPNGFEKTMAQLTLQEKNSISHRGRAIAQLEEGLKSEE